jgi:hypothetical protein
VPNPADAAADRSADEPRAATWGQSRGAELTRRGTSL